MTSIFGEMDWDSVPDDPFNIPDNTYIAYVTEVKVGPNQNGDKNGITFTYTISSGEYDGRKVTEWKTIPDVKDPKNPTDEEARQLSFLKSRLLDLGVPPARLNTVIPGDLIGTRVVMTTRKKGQYVNVNRVKQVGEDFDFGEPNF